MIDYEKIVEGVEGPTVFIDLRTVYFEAFDVEGQEVDEAGLTDEEIHEIRDSGRTFYPVNHPRYAGIAESKGYDQSYSRIEKTRYTHDAMIDAILADPTVKQNKLAEMFDRTPPWISRIIGSDAFQAALAKRREELTDPFLVATIEERFRGLAMQSLDVIAEKLGTTQNADLALKALDISSKALGFGARGAPGGGNVQNNFVVQLPPKIEDAGKWAEAYTAPVIEG